MKIRTFVVLLGISAAAIAATEEPIDSRFRPATPDPLIGDWAGEGGVAQVISPATGTYQVVVLQQFDDPEPRPVAVLRGAPGGLTGDGWSGAIADGNLRLANGDRRFELRRVTRPSPTLGAKPPGDAVVLFDGTSLAAWSNKSGKQWLTPGGPAPWKIVDDRVLEVVPGTGGGIISKRAFGDCHLHVEFRTLGTPSNSGVFLQTRYEVNINETYGSTDGTPNGGFDNCTPKGTAPKIRATRPPLEWQTLDIDFTAPRFDAVGTKTASATGTVYLNGVKLYDRQPLDRPHGAASRLGEAATGPLMLQEHGMPVQFRNIWVVAK